MGSSSSSSSALSSHTPVISRYAVPVAVVVIGALSSSTAPTAAMASAGDSVTATAIFPPPRAGYMNLNSKIFAESRSRCCSASTPPNSRLPSSPSDCTIVT